MIRNSDGDTLVECVTKQELLKRINQGDYAHASFLTELPTENDTNYWGEGVLIIKGSIVSPFEQKVITEFNID